MSIITKLVFILLPTFGPNQVYLDNVRIETPHASARVAAVSEEVPTEYTLDLG